MNTKKKKMTAGKVSNSASDARPSPSTSIPASSSCSSNSKKKGSNNQHSQEHEPKDGTAGTAASPPTAGSGQQKIGSSSHSLTAAPSPSASTSSSGHPLKSQPPGKQSHMKNQRPGGPGGGHEAGHRRHVEAEDLPIDCSFARRRNHFPSGSHVPDRSDDVVNTAFSNTMYHVRDPDDLAAVSNGLDLSFMDSGMEPVWIAVPDQKNGLCGDSPSLSSLTTDSSSSDTRSGSLSPAVPLMPQVTDPIRVAAVIQPQPAPPQPQPAGLKSIPKPQMDREERVKSLAKQANLLIDEGMPMETPDDEEKIRDAIQLLDVAIKIDANDYRLFINRGYCYEILSHYDKALDDADRAVAIKPVWANCHFRRGRALAGMQRFKEAEKSFNRSLTYDTQIREEVVKEMYQLRLNACLNLGFPVNEARDSAEQANSVAEAIQLVVQNSADLQQNFPSDLPITSGSVTSSSVPLESSIETPPATNFWPSLGIDSTSVTAAAAGVRRRSSCDSSRTGTDHLPVSVTASNESLHPAVAQVAAATTTTTSSSSDMVNGGAGTLSGGSGSSSHRNNIENSHSHSKTMSQKEILVESVITNKQLFHWCPDLETRNESGWFALWIGNISPVCSNDLLREMFSMFGDLVHCKVYPSDDPSGVSYALAHYDNDQSPIHAMAEYQGAVLRGVSARDKLPLVIRFRPNKEQKERDRLLTGSGNNNNINWSTSGGSQANNHFVSSDDTAIRKVSSSTEAAGSGGGGYNNHSTTGSPDSHPKKPTPVPPMGECYFWRTTGCRNGPQCRFAHYPSSKGIDFAPFMKRTTSSSSCHPVTNKSYRK